MTTWANAVATGVGPVEYRLVIEGCRLEFCTDGLTVGACTEAGQDGVTRVHGLLREGIGFSENAYLAGAEIEIGINPIRIVETPHPYLDAATSVFAARSQVLDWLASTLTSAGTSMSTLSDAGIGANGYYHIGTEVVRVTAGVSTTTLTVQRGKWRTTGQRHPVTSASETPELRSVHDEVTVWSGRRVWLYAHGTSELDVGDVGAIVWRGVLAGEPQLEGGDATTWILNMDSRWSLLDQEVGAGDSDGRPIQGIYYPSLHPFSLTVSRGDNATFNGFSNASPPRYVNVVGWFRTNEEFLAELLDRLNTIVAPGWSITFAGRENDGQWELLVDIASADPRYIFVRGGSAVDGWMSGRLRHENTIGGPPGADAPSVLASARYYVQWMTDPLAADPSTAYASPRTREPSELRRAPRAMNWQWPGIVVVGHSHPVGRVYLSNVVGVGVGDALLMIDSDADGNETTGSYTVTAVDSGASYVEAARASNSESPIPFVGVGLDVPEVKIGVRFGSDAGATLSGFRAAIIANATDLANGGSAPWVLADDVADWAGVVSDAASGIAFLERRDYTFWSGVRLAEVLKHEARLHGLFFYLDSAFRIALRPLTLDTQDIPSTHILGEDDYLVDDGFGELTSGEDGSVNTIEFHRGYDPVEDKHSSKIEVRNVAGISAAKKRRVLEVRPRVRPMTGDISAADAQRLADPVRALFGGKIHHYTLAVTLRHFEVRIGDTVLVTSRVLPYAGERAINGGVGMSSARALVVGREWDLETGTGRITVLVTGIDTYGYAPTGRVASATGAGTSWTLTLVASHYAPASVADASYFRAGDAVVVREWDATSPTTRTGTVSSVSGNDVLVTLDASWAGVGGSTWTLVCGQSNVSSSAQLSRFVWLASSSWRITLPSGTVKAREFAP